MADDTRQSLADLGALTQQQGAAPAAAAQASVETPAEGETAAAPIEPAVVAS